jgi:arylsulfatase A-like enzyme
VTLPLRIAQGARALGIAALLVVLPHCGDRKEPDAPPRSQATYDLQGVPVRALPTKGPRPNVLLVVIDTLRADMLDPRAAGGGAMPRLAELARQGVAFTQASAPAPWTQPSITSLLTGRLPSGHGVTGEDVQVSEMRALATWAEIFANGLGYRTEAWVGGPWKNTRGQMLEGFERVVPHVTLRALPDLVPRFAADRRTSPRPFFLLLHTFEAHDPYGAANHPHPATPVPLDPQSDPVAALGPSPEPAALVRGSILDRVFHAHLWRNPKYAEQQTAALTYQWSGLRDQPNPELAAELRAAYTAGVTWVDGLLGLALEQLRAAKLLDDTLVIVTGDHGEAFGEHGLLLHGRQLYDELLRVPLVMAGPPPFTGGRIVEGSASLLDLLPTVLDLVAAPHPEGLDGGSLLPLVRGTGPGRPAVSEERQTPRRTAGQASALLLGVRNEAWKAIVTYDHAKGTVLEEAYDLRADPLETKNLANAEGRLVHMPFDAAFCATYEALRDRIWSAHAAADFEAERGYRSGAAALGERPPPACDPVPKR